MRARQILIIAGVMLAACQPAAQGPSTKQAPTPVDYSNAPEWVKRNPLDPQLQQQPQAASPPAVAMPPVRETPLISIKATDLPSAPEGAVTIEGRGPVRIGMTLDELNVATGSRFKASDFQDEESGCAMLEPEGFPSGVAVMLLDGAVARIDVYEAGVPTYGGLMVGSSAADISRVFGSAVNAQPHFYSGAPSQYLTVWTIAPTGPPDGRGESVDPFDVWIKTRGLRFETDDGGKITMFRGGSGAIEMVEGCQ